MLLRSLTAIICLVFCSNTLAAYCLEDWACWEVKQVDGRYEFWVKNQQPFPFTSTLDVKANNLRSSTTEKKRFSKTSVLAGHSAQLVLTLYPVDEGSKVTYQDIFYWSPGIMGAEHDDQIRYQLPFAPGEAFSLVQGFGGGWSHRGGSKYAVDFAMPEGTPVHAAREGIVVRTESQHNRGGAHRRYAQYANFVVVLHDDGTTGEYHHLMQDGVEVAVGDRVKQGDLLGYSGNTGFSSLPHLHFAVYRPKPFGDFESIPFRFVDDVRTRRRW